MEDAEVNVLLGIELVNLGLATDTEMITDRVLPQGQTRDRTL